MNWYRLRKQSSLAGQTIGKWLYYARHSPINVNQVMDDFRIAVEQDGSRLDSDSINNILNDLEES